MRNNILFRGSLLGFCAVLLAGVLSIAATGNVQNFSKNAKLPGAVPASITVLALAEHNAAVQTVFNHAFAEIKTLAARLQPTGAQSDIVTINQRAAQSPVQVSEDTIRLFKLARKLNRLTKGAFTVVTSSVGSMSDIKVHKKTNTIAFEVPGMQVDVTPLIDGFVADRLMQIVWDANIDNAMVEVGSATRSVGYDSVGPWKKTIADMVGKYAGRGVAISYSNAATATVQTATATPQTGKRTGMPEASGVHSATVIAKDAALAQGVADAIYHMKPADGIALANRLSNVQAVIRDSDGTLLRSSGL